MKLRNYVYATAILFLLPTVNACSDYDENYDGQEKRLAQAPAPLNADDIVLENVFTHALGYVYTQGNEAGTNFIYYYEQQAGSDDLIYKGMVASGGAGNASPLGAQGSIFFNRKKGYLYAVNAGDNTISSFLVNEDGSLELKHTEPSGGLTPVSLTISQNFMFVVHSDSNNIQGFSLGTDGVFTPIANSSRNLSSPFASPGEISFSPNGRYLYVSEKMTNKIARFRVPANGRPSGGIFLNSVGQTPFGFDFSQNKYLIVANAESGNDNLATAASYSGANNGNTVNVNGAVPNNFTESSRLATTEHGFYAFVTNTATDNISSYSIDTDGNLSLAVDNIPSGEAPTDLTISANNFSVYVLCEKDHTIRSYYRTRFGGLQFTGKVANIPEGASGLAAW